MEKTHCKQGHELTPENTYVNPSTNAHRCKLCRNAYKRQWYQENKDSIRKSRKAYREANRDNIREYGKAYYEANKPAYREYRQANKERLVEYHRAYFQASKEPLREYRNEYARQYRLRKKIERIGENQ